MKNLSSKQRVSVASKATWLLSLSLFCGLQFSCQSRTTNIKDDLQQYLAQAKQWTAAEEQLNDAVATVRRDEFVHDDLVTETLKPMVSVSRNHVNVLEQYHPQTPPLTNVHEEYVAAWRSFSIALSLIVDAVAKKDYVLLAKAKNDLQEAQQSVASALADLAHLLREVGLLKETQPESSAPTKGN